MTVFCEDDFCYRIVHIHQLGGNPATFTIKHLLGGNPGYFFPLVQQGDPGNIFEPMTLFREDDFLLQEISQPLYTNRGETLHSPPSYTSFRKPPVICSPPDTRGNLQDISSTDNNVTEETQSKLTPLQNSSLFDGSFPSLDVREKVPDQKRSLATVVELLNNYSRQGPGGLLDPTFLSSPF